MKRFFITTLLMIAVAVCPAQTHHLKFKGVPMEGTLTSFTNQLKTKGFTPVSNKEGVSVLTGEFAGYKGCTIAAVADNSGMICKVSAILPTMDKWGELEECYMDFKDMLTEKYGQPKSCTEIFQNRYVNDDNDKIHELEFDRCKYICIFSCEEGDIQLEITHERYQCFVMLSYYDNANQKKLRERIMEEL